MLKNMILKIFRNKNFSFQMKLMQQHSSNVNVQGQPPEKKLRVAGGYTNGGDPSNYDYQVNTSIDFFSSSLT